MKRFLDPSTRTPFGWFKDAEIAGPGIPAKVAIPLPATVEMMPLADTFRIRWFSVSAMKRFPEASTAIPVGRFNDAKFAAPPSPANLKSPLPAMVEMMPLAETFRIRSLRESAIKRFPEASTATPWGFNDADVAGPPSPEKPGPLLPPPTATVMMPLADDTFKIRKLAA